MSDHAQVFITHLDRLRERDRGALAALRRSLSFPPGSYPPAFPYVERFVGYEMHAQDARRRALYLTAGLYALHPENAQRTLAAALGQLMRQRDSESIEKRFLALLSADAENLDNYLRQVAGLLAADDFGLNYALLLGDLSIWLNPHAGEGRDRVRQTWARDFYRALVPREPEPQAIFSENIPEE